MICDDKTAAGGRISFSTSYTDESIHLQIDGRWDDDLLDGLIEFIVRQRRRLARPSRGKLICDGWETINA